MLKAAKFMSRALLMNIRVVEACAQLCPYVTRLSPLVTQFSTFPTFLHGVTSLKSRNLAFSRSWKCISRRILAPLQFVWSFILQIHLIGSSRAKTVGDHSHASIRKSSSPLITVSNNAPKALVPIWSGSKTPYEAVINHTSQATYWHSDHFR
jgi:hypothetical protein